MSERERIAAELHEQYLATARRLNWPLRPDVDRPYEQLSDAAKELDRVFADWHLAELERHQAEDAKAITRLSGLLARAVAALWDAPLNSEGKKWIEEVSLELSDGETVPAIQRAREGTP